MKKQNGFSLIEILVVLVIMGLLISVVAPTVLNSADDARIQKVQADFKSIETALKIYRLDNYVYPTTEQGLVALVTAQHHGTLALRIMPCPARLHDRRRQNNPMPFDGSYHG